MFAMSFERVSMLIGYARVSTRDQTTELQTEALSAAGCERVFEDQSSGSREDRPGLSCALDYLRTGDTLIAERTRAGLDAARKAGRNGGRPAKMTPGKITAARKLLEKSRALSWALRYRLRSLA